jgi:acyl-CoA synthetase (AMP-forming)/AMP-acid ligase II
VDRCLLEEQGTAVVTSTAQTLTMFATGRLTIDLALAYNAEHYGDREAVKFGGTSVTYAELDSLINRCAHSLRSRGLKRGDHVLILVPNSIEYLVTLFATQRAGGVSVGCNPAYTRDEIAYQLVHSDAMIAVSTPERVNELAAIADSAGQSIAVVTAGKTAGASNTEFDDLGALMKEMPDTWLEDGARAEEPGIIFYTSGTTARPKGIVWSNASYYTCARRCRDGFGYTFGERVLNFFPMNHAMGGAAILVPTILVAGTIVIAPKFSVSGFVSTLRDEQISMTALLSTHAKYLLASPEDPHDSDHTLRRAMFGLPLDARRRSRFTSRFGIRLIGFLGMTEVPGITHVASLHSNYSTINGGLPVPDLERQVVDENGREVDAGATGELLLRSPHADGVCSGYYKDADATAGLFQAGWLRTGDIVRIDSQGAIEFVERAKDMIKRSGYNVAAAEVERVLLDHPAVTEAAVVGIPDPNTDESVVAFVIARIPSSPQLVDDLTTLCAERLVHYKRPAHIFLIQEFPYDQVGKVRKRELRQIAHELVSQESFKDST